MTDAGAERVDPPYEADEKTMLLAYLDFHRATLRWKCENLTPAQLATRAVATSTQRTPLEATFKHPRVSEPMSHRWVLMHMIEEYARHNGHADFLREAIDGATGE